MGWYLEARMMNDPNDLPGEGRSERRAARGGGGGFSAARGAALIGVAVILGVVLLNAIDDGNDGPVGDGGPASSTTSSSTTTTTVAKGSGDGTSSTTAKAATIPPSQVTVLVLNGSGRDGVATTLTNSLKAKGYKTLPPSNAAVRAGTVIDAKAGKTAACTTLAASVPGAKVQAMPTPPPVATEADCIVIIGS